MSLEYHYETIGFILDHLIAGGLKRVDFDTADAMEVMRHRIGDDEQVLETFNDVLHWMIDEGIIRAQSIQDGEHCDYFNRVQLTAKGLAIIEQTPNKDAGLDQSIAKTLGSKEGTLSAEIYGKIGSFVGGAAGGFLQSFG